MRDLSDGGEGGGRRREVTPVTGQQVQGLAGLSHQTGRVLLQVGGGQLHVLQDGTVGQADSDTVFVRGKIIKSQ